MSFFTKLIDGVKTALPSKKGKQNPYEEDFEEETLDDIDKELASYERAFSKKEKIEDVLSDDNYSGGNYRVNPPASEPKWDEEEGYRFDDEPTEEEISFDLNDEPLDSPDDADFDVQGIKEEAKGVQPAFPVVQNIPAYTRSTPVQNNEDVPVKEAPKASQQEEKKGFFSNLREKAVPKKKTPKKSVVKKKEQKPSEPVKVDPKQLGLVAILLVLLGFLGLLLFGGPDKSKIAQETQNQTEAEEVPVASNIPAQNQADSIFVNPFFDSKKLAEMQKQEEEKKNANGEGGGSGGTAVAGTALPAIPSNYPAPNIPAFNPPALPGDANGTVAAPAKVTGVMHGNDGSSVAILSDGNVVSAGETYKDGRIAYIGGDGIHFEDGSMMEYRE